MLICCRSVLADSVKLVEEKHQGSASREIENLPQVSCGFSKVRGHYCVKSHRGQRKIKLACQCFYGNRLSASRRSTEQDFGNRANAMRAEQFFLASLEHDAFQRLPYLRTENKVLKFATGFADFEK